MITIHFLLLLLLLFHKSWELPKHQDTEGDRTVHDDEQWIVPITPRKTDFHKQSITDDYSQEADDTIKLKEYDFKIDNIPTHDENLPENEEFSKDLLYPSPYDYISLRRMSLGSSLIENMIGQRVKRQAIPAVTMAPVVKQGVTGIITTVKPQHIAIPAARAGVIQASTMKLVAGPATAKMPSLVTPKPAIGGAVAAKPALQPGAVTAKPAVGMITAAKPPGVPLINAKPGAPAIMVPAAKPGGVQIQVVTAKPQFGQMINKAPGVPVVPAIPGVKPGLVVQTTKTPMKFGVPGGLPSMPNAMPNFGVQPKPPAAIPPAVPGWAPPKYGFPGGAATTLKPAVAIPAAVVTQAAPKMTSSSFFEDSVTMDMENFLKEAMQESSSNSTGTNSNPFNLDGLVGGFLGGLASGPGPSTPAEGGDGA